MKEDSENYRPVTVNSAPGEMKQKILLGATERHFKDNAIIRHSQHGFTKANPCLSFYDKVGLLVGEENADMAFPDFRKAFDTVPYSILLDKLSNCEMMLWFNPSQQLSTTKLLTHFPPTPQQWTVMSPSNGHLCWGRSTAGASTVGKDSLL